ncbi:MAG: VCBS repeat-containing protein [Desulfocapsaceae bacterium]|jgi:hypothetical protein|nr:VCBS repeat-containing protein [Desulfocapsaceae bacterium]
MRRFYLVLIIAVGFFHWHTAGHAENNREAVKIAVLPLQGMEEGQYRYLNSSVRQMLLSRLAGRPGLQIVDSPFVSENPQYLRDQLRSGEFDDVRQKVDADILLDGTLYSLKDGVQLNLDVHTFAPEADRISYSVKAESADGILAVISDLAAQVAEATIEPAKEVAETTGTGSTPDGLSGFQTPHPERDYKKGLFAGATLFGGEESGQFQSKGIRKSSTISITIETVALGDLDGDGSNELVVASRSKIRIFQFAENRFREIAGYDLLPQYKIHVINIGDPGNTGTMKLFVSADKGKRPSSQILSWDGSKKLQLIQGDIGYYIRPLWWPGRDIILAGQADSPNISDNFLAPGVFELIGDFTKDEMSKGPALLLPEGTNLFDFIVADLNGDKEVETMVIDKNQKLLVYDSGLNLSWVSSANYGGSKTFFGPSISSADNLDPNSQRQEVADLRKLIYIPGRLDLKDITGDGLPEVVVSTNDVGIDKYFKNLRTYDGGAVACLTWRGAGLMELWRTNHIEGYVADYAFDEEGSTDGDSRLARLYVAQIPDSTIWELVLPGNDDSRILAYEMTVKKEQP